MNIRESLKMAFSAIRSNKMRTLLTMLGIIIGISSVITLVTLGNGSKNMMTKEFENYGSNRAYVYVSSGEDDESESKDMEPYYMKASDIEMINRIYGDKLEGISFSSGFSGSFIQGRKTYNISFSGVSESYKDIENMTLESGRFLSKEDMNSENQVIVIEQKMVDEYYNKVSPIGQMLTVDVGGQTQTFRIIGVYSVPKAMMVREENNSFSVYTPYTLASSINESDLYAYFEANIKEGNDVKKTLQSIVSILERKHDAIGKGYYIISTAESQMKMMNKLTGTITLFVTAVAAISLLVGGIGIMNIMLVSVTERTREIGIRKALGATHKEILSQFLIEAVIISLIGGMIGTLLGIGIAELISKFAKIQASADLVTIMIAWSFSALVGILFGLLPANKAAKLNPIDALRYE